MQVQGVNISDDFHRACQREEVVNFEGSLTSEKLDGSRQTSFTRPRAEPGRDTIWSAVHIRGDVNLGNEL